MFSLFFGFFLTRSGVVYLVADIVGAVSVSPASSSLPQLRHVSLVSPPGRSCLISRVRGKEGERGGIQSWGFSDKVLLFL